MTKTEKFKWEKIRRTRLLDELISEMHAVEDVFLVAKYFAKNHFGNLNSLMVTLDIFKNVFHQKSLMLKPLYTKTSCSKNI